MGDNEYIRYTVSFVDNLKRGYGWRSSRINRGEIDLSCLAIAFEIDVTTPDMRDQLRQFIQSPPVEFLRKSMGHPIVLTTGEGVPSLMFFARAAYWPIMPHPIINPTHRRTVVALGRDLFDYTAQDAREFCHSPLTLIKCKGCEKLSPRDGYNVGAVELMARHCAKELFEQWREPRLQSAEAREECIPLPNTGAASETPSIDAFMRLLKRIHVGDFRYLAPHLAQDRGPNPNEPSILPSHEYDWPNETLVDRNRMKYVDAALEGQESREHAKICEQCAFIRGCRGRYGRKYLGRMAKNCHREHDSYNGGVAGKQSGPFDPELWEIGLAEWKKEHPDVNWDDVSLFAYDVSEHFTTKLVPGMDGLTAHLTRMSPNLDRVIFTRHDRHVSLSIEDAKLILRAENHRRYSPFYRDTYERNLKREITPLEQALYIEACNIRHWNRRTGGFCSGVSQYDLKTVRLLGYSYTPLEIEWYCRGVNHNRFDNYEDWANHRFTFYYDNASKPTYLLAYVPKDIQEGYRRKLLEKHEEAMLKKRGLKRSKCAKPHYRQLQLGLKLPTEQE